jgi:hypothetical protein
MPMLNPWLILGFVLAFGAAVVGSYVKGHSDGVDVEAMRWKVSMGNQQAEAFKKLEAANAATAARERVIAALKDKVEGDYVAGKTKSDAAYTAGLRAGRVFVDRGAACRPGRDPGVPGDPGDAPGAAAAAAGCELSREARDFLRELAHDADGAALIARAGHDYAVGLASKP